MNQSFFKFNHINSLSIEDVKHFSATIAVMAELKKDELTRFPYFGKGEFQFASEWTYPQFDYVLNYLGFRNETSPDHIDLAAFGCSFTFGTGLPVDKLWHTLIGNKLNMTSANYGMPGASIKSIIDVALIISNHVNIKKAIFLLPTYNRIQIAKSNPNIDEINYLSVIPNHKSELCKAYGIEAELLARSIPDEEMVKVMRDSLYLVDYIFKQRGIKAYYTSWDPETYGFISKLELDSIVLPEWTSIDASQASTDLARDKLHPGPKHHAQFVEKIIDYVV
jgi:hypothetical protein